MKNKNSQTNRRSLFCKPEQQTGNTWLVPSLSRAGVKYKVEVFYLGESPSVFVSGEITPLTAHGLNFQATCTCPDFQINRNNCKHGIAVLRRYENNFGLIFDFFGLARSSRFAELNRKINETDARIARSQERSTKTKRAYPV